MMRRPVRPWRYLTYGLIVGTPLLLTGCCPDCAPEAESGLDDPSESSITRASDAGERLPTGRRTVSLDELCAWSEDRGDDDLLAYEPEALRDSDSPAPVAMDLLDALKGNRLEGRQRFIVQTEGAPEELLERLPAGLLKHRGSFRSVQAMAIEAPPSVVCALARDEGVRWISPDRDMEETGSKMKVNGHLAITSGAGQSWPGGASGSNVDGTGISIAILDSGIYGQHPDFQGVTNWTLKTSDGQSRILTQVDFTGESLTAEQLASGSDV